ncbi:hypothetical protein [Hydrogenophaga sp. RWCD_12]|uniref:hypothetical protein n=1 Tax=Hydrogenophaga sp. RWCD_12 TaxID=3391190 RepID=UPI003984D9CF
MKLLRRRLLVACLSLGPLTIKASEFNTKGGSMHPTTSAAEFQSFLARRGILLSSIDIPQLVESALSFYETVKAAGLAEGSGADMLLCQWGVYNWGQGEHFEFDITRQFVGAEDDDDDAMSQLRCTAYFEPLPALRAIPASNRWCESLANLPAFSVFVRESAAFQAVQSLKPLKVSVEWSGV